MPTTPPRHSLLILGIIYDEPARARICAHIGFHFIIPFFHCNLFVYFIALSPLSSTYLIDNSDCRLLWTALIGGGVPIQKRPYLFDKYPFGQQHGNGPRLDAIAFHYYTFNSYCVITQVAIRAYRLQRHFSGANTI